MNSNLIRFGITFSFTIFLGLQAAMADQCAYIEKAQAEKAMETIKVGDQLVSYCEPCGESSSIKGSGKLEIVSTVSSEPTGYENTHEVKVNGKGIDLAYTFIKKKTFWDKIGLGSKKYNNLSKLVGCPSEAVSTKIHYSKRRGVFEPIQIKGVDIHGVIGR